MNKKILIVDDSESIRSLLKYNLETSGYETTVAKDGLEALEIIAEDTELAVVKTGKTGSLVKYEGKVYKIPVVTAHAIDTTGAGDVYAAGFLYGMINDMSLMDAGYIASLMAAKVIETYGAKIPQADLEFINREIESLRSV
jgi:sugar/nucleoside kinase (ribokinase family)